MINNTFFMAVDYRTLATKYAPELYYVDTKNSFKSIAPKDMGGLYWRLATSSVPWADVCIQYIVYFKQQQWVPSILVKILERFSGELGKLPGNHPNDYVPIFLYFKNGKPIRAAFDVCHYEVVGVVNIPSRVLPRDGRPKFQVKNFYRGILPLENGTEYTILGGPPTPLSQERLTDWWKGRTSTGSYDNEAKLIIRDKLQNPFQEITTFRDFESKYGDIFHWIFWSAKKEEQPRKRARKVDTDAVTMRAEKRLGEMKKNFSHEDIKALTEFVDQNIFEESRVPEYLVLRGSRKFQRI